MKKGTPKHLYWVFSNVFGYLFGWAFLAPLYHAVINLSLHGLGYDNMYRISWTGEDWFIKNVLAPSKPKVCFDIGANIGAYSTLLLQYTSAEIFAVEPSSSAFNELSKLDSRITKIQAAVADFEGEATLHSKGTADEKASLDESVRSGDSETVKVETIASLAKKYDVQEVDFIKIDTEGYEREVLQGLGSIRPTFIQIEFNHHHIYRDITLYGLSKLLPGYEFYRLIPHGWLKIDPEKYLNNIYVFSNVIAIKRDIS